MTQKIGKYEIVRELGRGATSVVFEAVDPFTGRRVAIKRVLPEALRDRQNGKRYQKLFVAEASLAGKLSHPHIAMIYDAVAEDAHAGTITYAAASADAMYEGLSIAPQTVAIADNDAAGLVIGQSGGTTTVAEGGLGDTFTVALTSRPTAAIRSASSRISS